MGVYGLDYSLELSFVRDHFNHFLNGPGAVGVEAGSYHVRNYHIQSCLQLLRVNHFEELLAQIVSEGIHYQLRQVAHNVIEYLTRYV